MIQMIKTVLPPFAHAFKALRPYANYLSQVIAPPYDIVTTAEAKHFALQKPYNFFHLSKPEIDCSNEDQNSEAIYEQATTNWKHFERENIWINEEQPAYYLYRLQRGSHRQLGILAAINTAAYKNGRIRQHELTRENKLQDRIQLTQALQAQISPVLLTHRPLPALQQLLHTLTETHQPIYQIIDSFKVQQEVWQVNDAHSIQTIAKYLEEIETYYIADGHHRAAAAAAIAETTLPNTSVTWNNSFLAGIFSADELVILPYQRLIKRIPHKSFEALMSELASHFKITPVNQPVQPLTPYTAGLYAQHQWYECQLLTAELANSRHDPLAHLPTQLLHQYLIEPIFKITDPRQDPNIDFIGGLNTLEDIQKVVDEGQYHLGITTAATTMDDLIAIADHNLQLPPKSTWFEPKLTDGFVMYK